MKYSFLYGLIFIILCVAVEVFTFGLIKQKESYQTVQTDRYTVSLPEDWTVTVNKISSSTLTFEQVDKELGGIDILGYYPDQPICHLYHNHTETIYSKRLDGFFTDTIQAKFRCTPPAAAHEDWVKELIHIYFLIKDENIAYDIWVNSDDVSEETLLSIAKRFEIK